jgi:hypothetical protein
MLGEGSEHRDPLTPHPIEIVGTPALPSPTRGEGIATRVAALFV